MDLVTETRYISDIFLIENININGDEHNVRIRNNDGLLAIEFFSGGRIFSVSIKSHVTIGRRIARHHHYYDNLENPDEAYDGDYEFLSIKDSSWGPRDEDNEIEFGARQDEY